MTKVTKTLVEGGHAFELAKGTDHIEYHELGGYHGGPYCAKCEDYFCQHCNEDVFTEQCPETDQTLPGLEWD